VAVIQVVAVAADMKVAEVEEDSYTDTDNKLQKRPSGRFCNFRIADRQCFIAIQIVTKNTFV
jgi:hypothetical protein